MNDNMDDICRTFNEIIDEYELKPSMGFSSFPN